MRFAPKKKCMQVTPNKVRDLCFFQHSTYAVLAFLSDRHSALLAAVGVRDEQLLRF